MLDLRNEKRLLRFYSPSNRKALKRSSSIKPRKFRTFALIPPPKNYYRRFQHIVNQNVITLAPPYRLSKLGVPPHVQILHKRNSFPEENLTIQKERPDTPPIPREHMKHIRQLPSCTETD